MKKSKLDEMAAYLLMVLSGVCAGVGTSNTWIGFSVFFALKALYRGPLEAVSAPNTPAATRNMESQNHGAR